MKPEYILHIECYDPNDPSGSMKYPLGALAWDNKEEATQSWDWIFDDYIADSGIHECVATLYEKNTIIAQKDFPYLLVPSILGESLVSLLCRSFMTMLVATRKELTQ